MCAASSGGSVRRCLVGSTATRALAGAKGERRLGELVRAGWIERDEEHRTVAPTARLENLIRLVLRTGDATAPTTVEHTVAEVMAEIVRASPELSDDTKGNFLREWIASFVGDALWPWQEDRRQQT